MTEVVIRGPVLGDPEVAGWLLCELSALGDLAFLGEPRPPSDSETFPPPGPPERPFSFPEKP